MCSISHNRASLKPRWILSSNTYKFRWVAACQPRHLNMRTVTRSHWAMLTTPCATTMSPEPCMSHISPSSLVLFLLISETGSFVQTVWDEHTHSLVSPWLSAGNHSTMAPCCLSLIAHSERFVLFTSAATAQPLHSFKCGFIINSLPENLTL